MPFNLTFRVDFKIINLKFKLNLSLKFNFKLKLLL